MRNVLIADKQAITRIGIETLIREQEKKAVLHRVEGKSELIQMLIRYPDALVVLDYSLFDMGSADELLNINARFSKSHWLLFSEELSGDFLKRILFSSASFSVVLKSSDLDEITMAITHAYRDERFVCSRVTNQLLQSAKQMSGGLREILTNTETEILKEIAMGRTTKEIAAIRNLSFHTIITHRKNIFRKLEVNNVHEATKYAMRAGIIDTSDYYI